MVWLQANGQSNHQPVRIPELHVLYVMWTRGCFKTGAHIHNTHTQFWASVSCAPEYWMSSPLSPPQLRLFYSSWKARVSCCYSDQDLPFCPRWTGSARAKYDIKLYKWDFRSHTQLAPSFLPEPLPAVSRSIWTLKQFIIFLAGAITRMEWKDNIQLWGFPYSCSNVGLLH